MYIQTVCIFAAATGVVRIRQQDGGVEMSEPFNIERGVLQGDIFSPVCFIAGLDRIFRLYDHVNPGMTVCTGAHTVRMAKFEYADDAALIDEDTGQATARVTSLAAGSIADAAMIISAKKSKVMHIHKTTRTSPTSEADVDKLNLVHKCESCTREFKYQTTRAENAHGALVRRGPYAAIMCRLLDWQSRQVEQGIAEASLDKVVIGSDPPLENVPHFQYLGSRLQGDGSDEADVGHRLEIAQSEFSTLSHLWADHRLSRTTKLRLYRVCVCSSLTHCCEAWTLNRAVTRSINGFNTRCLHVLTGEHYRETAIAPAYDLVLAVRRRRLGYLGHVLRMPAERMVRRALMALVSDSVMYPTGSLFSDCQGVALPQLVAMASIRTMWRAKVASLSWTCVFWVTISCTTIVP